MSDYNAVWLLTGFLTGALAVSITAWFVVKLMLRHIMGHEGPVVWAGKAQEIEDTAGEIVNYENEKP